MAIDLRRLEGLEPRSERPRPTMVRLVSWVAALLLSLALWGALAVAVYTLVSA